MPPELVHRFQLTALPILLTPESQNHWRVTTAEVSQFSAIDLMSWVRALLEQATQSAYAVETTDKPSKALCQNVPILSEKLISSVPWKELFPIRIGLAKLGEYLSAVGFHQYLRTLCRQHQSSGNQSFSQNSPYRTCPKNRRRGYTVPQSYYTLTAKKPIQNEYVLAGTVKTESPLDRGFSGHLGNNTWSKQKHWPTDAQGNPVYDTNAEMSATIARLRQHFKGCDYQKTLVLKQGQQVHSPDIRECTRALVTDDSVTLNRKIRISPFLEYVSGSGLAGMNSCESSSVNEGCIQIRSGKGRGADNYYRCGYGARYGVRPLWWRLPDIQR